MSLPVSKLKRPRQLAVPATPADAAPSSRSFMAAVKSAIDTLAGQHGDLDRAVTFRDLKAGGLAEEYAGGYRVKPSDDTLAEEDLDGLLPEWEDVFPYPGEFDVPPAVTGFTAVGGYSTIVVHWDDPDWPPGASTFNIEKFELFRSTEENPSPAVPDSMYLWGQTKGLVVVDDVGTSQHFYYWIRIVGENGQIGPLTGPVDATTSIDVVETLALIEGQLSQDHFIQELNEKIDQIDIWESDITGLQSQVGSLLGAVSSLQGEVADLSGTPAYDAGTTYAAGDIVTYSGGLYRATASTTGNLPTDTNYWEKIGDYASIGAAVAAFAVSISDHETRIGDVEGDLTTEVIKRQTLAAQIRGSYAGSDLGSLSQGLIFEERQARATAVQAEANSRDALATQLRGGYTGSDLDSVTTGLIADERQARSSADGSLVSSINQLRTDAQTWDGNTLTSAQSWVQNNYVSQSSLSGAFSAHESSLRSEWQQDDGDTLNSAQSYVQGYAYTKAESDQAAQYAAAQEASQVAARLNSGGDIHQAIVQAQSTAETRVVNHKGSTPPVQKAVGDLWVDTSNGNQLKRWNGSAWEDAGDTRIGANASYVLSLQSSIIPGLADDISDLGGALDGLDVDGLGQRLVAVEMSASTSASKITGLEGKFSVKIDNNGHVTGFGLASTTNNDTPYGSFDIVADRFSITAPNYAGGEKQPFVYYTTNQVINGVAVPAGAYLKSAFIQDASITNAKIATVSADKLTAGSINAGWINTGSMHGDRITANTLNGNRILARSITADKISANELSAISATMGEVQSFNWSPGSSGFKLFANGSAEFNNITARGNIIANSVLAGGVNSAALASGAVTYGKLGSGAVGAGNIAPGAVTGSNIASGTITGDKIFNKTLSAIKLADNSVERRAIINNAIDQYKLANGAVVAGKLAANAIVANDGVIGNLAVGTLQIAGQAVSTEKLQNNSVTYVNAARASGGAAIGSYAVTVAMPAGYTQVTVLASVGLRQPTSGGFEIPPTVSLTKNTTTLSSVKANLPGVDAENSVAFTYVDNSPSGTYRIYVGAGLGVNWKDASISIIGTKGK